MTLLYETPYVLLQDEDGSSVKENVSVYQFEEFESEDFELLSHNEKISYLHLEKEKSTPNADHGSVTRYIFDPSDSFLVVRQSVITW